MNLWNRLFGSSQTKKGAESSDVISYHGVDFVLPDGLSCVVGQDSTQQVPVAMIGPKAEDKFDHCLIQLRCIDVDDRIADEDLIKYFSKYGSNSPERAHFGPWRGFQNQERKQEQAGQTQHLRLLLVWERRFLIVEYSAPVEWYEFYKTRLIEMLVSSKASSVAISKA